MWNEFQILQEGTENVKQYKINMLTQEYELFHMEFGENVESIQMQYINLINILENLGKTLSNQDYSNKVIRSMCKDWQPKVTIIKKSHTI